jgi:ornithine cyclodeaminase
LRVLDAGPTAAALPFARLIPALRARFAAGCVVPQRHVHELPGLHGAGITSLLMPAWIPGQFYGVKIINIAPGNGARGLPGLHASYLLHDAETGVPLALLDGTVLTARRTAAVSALAASMLARPDARHLLVLGAGRVARLLPEAYRCVLGITEVSVWARRAEQAEALAQVWRAEGWSARAVGDRAAAARQADIVSCATLADEPVVAGAWLQPGSHLDLIGSYTPAMREADDACFRHATLVVDTEEALVKSGDLLGPMARGVISAASVRATLAALCQDGTLAALGRGGPLPRSTSDARTVFKSVGTALADLAAAMLALQIDEPTPASAPQPHHPPQQA